MGLRAEGDLMSLRGRPVIRASVPPYAATWLLQRVPESAWAAAAATLRGYGREEQAADLEEGFRQLQGARELRVWTGDDGSDVGTSEPVDVALGAASAADEIPIAEAAQMLGVSERAVRKMCVSRRLVARAVHARLWMVDRASVLALVEARRSA